MKDQLDKVDNTDQKDLLRKQENSNKIKIPCLITDNRKLPMMRKIINKHWNVLQINPELQQIFQNNQLVIFKRNKNLQEIIGGHTFKMEKCLKPIQKTEKENVNPATQINHHYVASR